MFNIVFNPSRTTSLHFITNTVSILIDRSYPIRLGIVPLVETEGARIARVFYYLTEKYGRVATMPFFDAVREPHLRRLPSLIILGRTRIGLVPRSGAIRSARRGGEGLSFDILAGGTSEVFEARINKARAYTQRLGTDAASSPNGHTFIKGTYYVLDDNFCCNPVSDRHFSKIRCWITRCWHLAIFVFV
ncbi:hypothetical protein EDB85DRAFT_1489265 [Lactarius pseudohatsudake]|nr:hypothetical protein EDB85DRAFT_1489265 [Lactarius pseudohatsudake]